jgi:hypothetical protein
MQGYAADQCKDSLIGPTGASLDYLTVLSELAHANHILPDGLMRLRELEFKPIR